MKYVQLKFCMCYWIDKPMKLLQWIVNIIITNVYNYYFKNRISIQQLIL